ncbi:MAG: O-antigen ligase family protein [Nitrospirae bacterium]|nr:O-antigen ligase family protein [Nitrospirota bacterium]
MKEVVVFLVVISEFKSFRDIKPLLWILISSFAFITFASIIENVAKDWDTFYRLIPSTSWRQLSEYFFSGYANKATFYLPFIAAWLLSVKEEKWKKRLGIITLCFGFILLYIYNSRTAFISVPIAVLISLLLAERYKFAACYLLAALLITSFIITSDAERFSKYRTLADADTYVSDIGLSGRKGLWLVTFNLIKKRSLTGYGYGWKKMAWVAKDSELIEPLKKEYPIAYDYFTRQTHMIYGKVNPHNLFLQIAFEIGVTGLAVFILLWFTVIHKMITAIRISKEGEARNFLKCSIGLIVSYVIINLTNGFWQESYGNMIFLFMAMIFVIHRESNQ